MTAFAEREREREQSHAAVKPKPETELEFKIINTVCVRTTHSCSKFACAFPCL